MHLGDGLCGEGVVGEVTHAFCLHILTWTRVCPDRKCDSEATGICDFGTGPSHKEGSTHHRFEDKD